MIAPAPQRLLDLLGPPGWGARVAVIEPDGRRFDRDALRAAAGRVAAALAEAGVRAGDRVIVQERKSLAEVAAMFGAWWIGAVVVDVSVRWTAAQVAYVARDCRAAAILGGPTGEVPPEVADALPPRIRVAAGPPGGATEAPAPAASAPGALAAILYTSGSTGQPKGVMLSPRNLLLGADSVATYTRLGEDERLLSVLPYCFDAGLNVLTSALLAGGAVVHQPLSLPTEIVRLMAREGVTGLPGVPPMTAPVVRLLAAHPTPLPALRRVTNTGGKLPPDVLELLPQVFPGADIYLMYGLTEAFRATYLPPERYAAKRGAIGRAIPHAEVFVVTPGAGPAGPGETGELVQAGPLLSLGYWERPEETAAKFRPCPELAAVLGDRPVVWSGDLVRVDEDGELWFVSRRDEMIKTMGQRVSPTEVEDALAATGLVTEAVAFGRPHPDLGATIHAAITLAAETNPDDVLARLTGTVPRHMRPHLLHPWDGGMPRTASGKLDRPAIIAAVAARIEDVSHVASGS